MHKTNRSLLCLLAMLGALAASPALGQHADERAESVAIPANDSPNQQAEENADERAREGTRIVSQLGNFKTTGDRLTFHVAQSERTYLGLENLALERIGKVMADRRDQVDTLQWEVTGVFTEYRGANYLLVTHAVLKSKAGRGAAVLSSQTP